jgi:hypothetical protein
MEFLATKSFADYPSDKAGGMRIPAHKPVVHSEPTQRFATVTLIFVVMTIESPLAPESPDVLVAVDLKIDPSAALKPVKEHHAHDHSGSAAMHVCP